MSLNSDIQQSAVQGLITLYELDARKLGGSVYYFHGYNDGVIRWRGNDYVPIAITADGLEMRGDGRASMPKITVANVLNGIHGAISNLCLRYHDFVGAKLTVINTLTAYLNDTNDDNYKKQIWFIEQKGNENLQSVEFELSNPVDFEGQRIPVRQITNYCHWAICGKYKGVECGYKGSQMFDEHGIATDDPAEDHCAGLLSHCVLRFGENEPLPFGGFPSSNLL